MRELVPGVKSVPGFPLEIYSFRCWGLHDDAGVSLWTYLWVIMHLPVSGWMGFYGKGGISFIFGIVSGDHFVKYSCDFELK